MILFQVKSGIKASSQLDRFVEHTGNRILINASFHDDYIVFYNTQLIDL